MRETKSECNGCGAVHISFDYEVLVSSMDPLAGIAGLFTTLEQTQTSMSINSVIIIFEWIFPALPYLSFSPQLSMRAFRNSWWLNHRENRTTGLCLSNMCSEGKVFCNADCTNKILNWNEYGKETAINVQKSQFEGGKCAATITDEAHVTCVLLSPSLLNDYLKCYVVMCCHLMFSVAFSFFSIEVSLWNCSQ